MNFFLSLVGRQKEETKDAWKKKRTAHFAAHFEARGYCSLRFHIF